MQVAGGRWQRGRMQVQAPETVAAVVADQNEQNAGGGRTETSTQNLQVGRMQAGRMQGPPPEQTSRQVGM